MAKNKVDNFTGVKELTLDHAVGDHVFRICVDSRDENHNSLHNLHYAVKEAVIDQIKISASVITYHCKIIERPSCWHGEAYADEIRYKTREEAQARADYLNEHEPIE